MDANTIAAVLLATMPYAMGIRATTFLVLLVMLQDPRRRAHGSRAPSLLFGAIFLMALLEVFMAAFFAHRGNPANIDVPIEWVLLAGLNIAPVLSSVAAIRFLRWATRIEDHEISGDGVFATLARAMPVIVADASGTIHYTTDGLDELIGAREDEMYGRNLTEIMPARYRAAHRAGLRRYLDTGETHIIGTVVPVEMLCRNGEEKPVYLALTSADVEGKPWFVGAIWQRDPDARDQRQENTDIRQDARDVTQDAREQRQGQMP